jgi:hypothetical protein
MTTAKTVIWGHRFLALVGWMLIGVAAFALVTAASVVLLPHELTYLQATVPELYQGHHDGSLVGYIIHNRVSFAGALIITGGFYLWLVYWPLKQCQPWAWWTLLLSGFLGSATIFNYQTHDYLDSWHAFGTTGIALTLTIGLALSYSGLQRPNHIKTLIPQNLKSNLLAFPNWSPLFLGRIWLSVWAIGAILGGLIISITGMFPIFVPQDLEFMQTTLAALEQVNSRLIPFIAHDRIGFGGALFSWGIAAFLCIWHGLRPGSRRLLYLMCLLWLVELFTAILIHPVVGYNSLSHLAPFLIKDAFFLLGLAFVYPEVVQIPEPSHSAELQLSNH